MTLPPPVQPLFPEWVQWIQALGPTLASAVVGAAVVYVAVRQHRTAHEKLVLDLFDRRYAIVSKAAEQINRVGTQGHLIAFGVKQELTEIEGQAQFLFEDEVVERLREVNRGVGPTHQAYVQLKGVGFDVNDDNGVKAAEAIEQFNKKVQAFQSACLERMRMTQKL